MSDALPMIYLVRHGETAWTLTAQHTGRTDLPLNEQGERQAHEVGAGLAALRFEGIVSSPLLRARRTAELAMLHSLVETDENLMGRDHGAYEGRHTVDIEVERPDGAFSVTAAPAARRSNPWPRVRTGSSAAFAQAAAMCSSLPIAKSCAYLRCVGSGWRQ